MATIINNPGNGEESNSGVGMIIGIILLVVVIALFFIYALPAIRGNNTTPSTDVHITIPTGGGTTPAPAY